MGHTESKQAESRGSRWSFRKKKESRSESLDVIVWTDDELEEISAEMKRQVKKLIIYAHSADVDLQREVAETLANQAVKPQLQVMIVQSGGLDLLLPLTASTDFEVRRLAAHALANLSVDSENQILMAAKGGIEMVITLLTTEGESQQTLKQAAKALANLGVNKDNKKAIAEKNGLEPLIKHLQTGSLPVKVECAAALANLAVDDDNEEKIGEIGGLEAFADALATQDTELVIQVVRALRNLSVNPKNRKILLQLHVQEDLHELYTFMRDPVEKGQIQRALANLGFEVASHGKK